MTRTKPRLGFVGLGLMGSAMAEMLLADGYELAVWNLEAGPAEALAQKELSESSDPGTDADQHRRYATRWTLEAQIRHEALVELVEKVHTYAARAGAAWTVDAVPAASSAARHRDNTRSATGSPMPTILAGGTVRGVCAFKSSFLDRPGPRPARAGTRPISAVPRCRRRRCPPD